MAFAEKWNIKKIVFTSSIAPYGAAEELKKETTLPTPNIQHTVSLSWWLRRFMRSGRMAMLLIVNSLSFALVWYSEKVRS